MTSTKRILLPLGLVLLFSALLLSVSCADSETPKTISITTTSLPKTTTITTTSAASTNTSIVPITTEPPATQTVTTTPPTTEPITSSVVQTTLPQASDSEPPQTTLPQTTQEKPDETSAPVSDDWRWKRKITIPDWQINESNYNEETGEYKVKISIDDIHAVGPRQAAENFAKVHGFDMSTDYYRNSYYGYFITRATMEEIEAFARLDEVRQITLYSMSIRPDPEPVPLYVIEISEVTYGEKVCADGQTRTVFEIAFLDNGYFFTTDETNGLALSQKTQLQVSAFHEDSGYPIEPLYTITYFEAPAPNRFLCAVEGFTPEKGQQYYIVLSLRSAYEGALYPNAEHLLWAEAPFVLVE